MANINFFIPVEINALPEYLSSGFIGLLSSKDESVKDRQSLIFPNNLGLKNIESIQTNLCIEVSFPEERCTLDNSVVKTSTPIPISKIKKIIFFDEEERANFLASFKPFKEIPIEFFDYEYLIKTADPKTGVDLNKVKVKKQKINFAPNVLQSLIVAIVNSSHWLNHKVSLNYEISFPKAKLKRGEILKRQIAHLLKESKSNTSINEHSSTFLDLYLGATDLLISKNERPMPSNIVTSMLSLVGKYPDQEDYIRKLLDKMQSIMMGMESLPDLDDDMEGLTLQRGIVLAILLNGYDSFKSYRQNQKTGTIVESIARLLYISSNKLGHIPDKLWKQTKESFFSLLDSADDVIFNSRFAIKSSKEFEDDSFDAKEIITVNNIKLLEASIEPSPEVEHAINRLRSLKYAPRRASESKISIIKTMLDEQPQEIFVQPIDLKFLPQPQFKDNFKISLILKDFSKVLNSAKPREAFMLLAERYMITFSYSSSSKKDIEISRYQLSSTMDKDELEQHIELISIAAKQIIKEFA